MSQKPLTEYADFTGRYCYGILLNQRCSYFLALAVMDIPLYSNINLNVITILRACRGKCRKLLFAAESHFPIRTLATACADKNTLPCGKAVMRKCDDCPLYSLLHIHLSAALGAFCSGCLYINNCARYLLLARGRPYLQLPNLFPQFFKQPY